MSKSKIKTGAVASKTRANAASKFPAKAVKKVADPKEAANAVANAVANAKKVAPKKTVNFSVPLFSLKGTESGSLDLPKELFGKETNENLLAQAVRVYSTNQKNFTGSTKTRGEVTGSTRKIFKQKGTGNARHGAIRAPIFVGGGIVFGPKPRNVRLELPQKMKRTALLQAMSLKASEKQVLGLEGLEKATGKTQEMATLLGKISGGKKQKSALIITDSKTDNVVRAVRNLKGADVIPANLVNAYEVLRHELLLVTKSAVEKLANPVSVKKEETK